jgi:hypothetical protein
VDERISMSVARLRERAAHCRQLSLNATTPGVAQELDAIAAEYDREADQLEDATTDQLALER